MGYFKGKVEYANLWEERIKETDFFLMIFLWYFSLSVLKRKLVTFESTHMWMRAIEGFSDQGLLDINWRAEVNMSSPFKAHLTFLIFELWFSLFVGLLSKVLRTKGLLELKRPPLLPDPSHIWAMNCGKAIFTRFQGFSHFKLYIVPPNWRSHKQRNLQPSKYQLIPSNQIYYQL